MRGFVQGVVWGGLVAVSGLVVLSQVAGPVTPPVDRIALTPPASDPAEPVSDPAPPAAPPPAAPPPATPPAALPGSVAPAPVTPPPAAVAPQAAPIVAAPEQPRDQPPLAPVSDPPAKALASAGRIDPVVAPVERPAPAAATLPERLDTPSAEAAPVAVDPPPPPPAPPPPAAVPEAPPAPLAAETAASPGPASSVVTGRLPRIGADVAAQPTSPATGPVASGPASAGLADLPPRLRYARPFDRAVQQPLFAILLADTGAEDVNREALVALGLPLSIVIDPLAEGAAERAAFWRAAGQEVLMAASGIPVGAAPADLEQSLQVLAGALPEAVALIDSDGSAFQSNSPLADQMVSILADQGRGLVSLDQGLNAAAREARRVALPATTVFRRLDAADETAPVIGRYLDRAAFQAAQDGQVAVIGELRLQTVAAILQWLGEGRASSVALAPITALLQP